MRKITEEQKESRQYILKRSNGKSFYFKNEDNSKRGYNILIEVFFIDRVTKRPCYIGHSNETSASWRGGQAVARGIVSEVMGYKMKDGYHLVRKDITVWEV